MMENPIPLNITEDEVINLRWSEWIDVDSVEEGMARVKYRIGMDWPFQLTERGAIVYLDSKGGTSIAEVRSSRADMSSGWSYRVRQK